MVNLSMFSWSPSKHCFDWCSAKIPEITDKMNKDFIFPYVLIVLLIIIYRALDTEYLRSLIIKNDNINITPYIYERVKSGLLEAAQYIGVLYTVYVLYFVL